MITRLKSLELHGYKTFAGKTGFDFLGSTTAIVGPNGSGKSNIADSIRWVLGEQSYSLLRGRKTEDMIFAGSEQRPRASMASASILFNNEDNWLPIDYSEVSITRRAYRDGQNEYLINGQRVRLKEISELLAQSGLAERTYTIIGQGLVDAALSLKPDERRRFFEEAAGIGLYRRRREESLNRLIDTRRNLERVMDIISEIEPRLKSLEKQAQRVIEYERIKSDLRLLLRDWYGFHWHRAQQYLSHGQEVYRLQTSKLSETRQRLSEIETILNEDREQIQNLRHSLNEWHNQSAEKHRQREQINRDLAVVDERRRALLDQQQNFQSDLARLEEGLKIQKEKYDTLLEERDRLNAEHTEAQSMGEKARKAMRERQLEREVIEKKLHEQRHKLITTETRQVQLKAHMEELESRRITQQESRLVQIQSVEQEKEKVTELKSNLEVFSQNHLSVQQELSKVEADYRDIKNQLIKKETEIKNSLDEQSRIKVEISRFRAQLDVLKQAEVSMLGLNQGARFVLQSVKEGHIKGNYKALSSEIDVPSELEVAIAALLGDYLDGVVFDHQTDPDIVLSLLGQGEKGRTILLPEGSINGSKTINNNEIKSALAGMEASSYIGRASEMVKTPNEIRPVIEMLLGNGIIVSDRVTARKLVEKLPSARIVTKQGEVFWGNGVIVAGRDGREGIISRRRQKKEIQFSFDDFQKKLEQIDEIIRKLNESKTQYSLKSQELEKAIGQIKQSINQAGQVKQRAELELEQARQRLDWRNDQLKELDEQAQIIEENGKSLKDDIDRIKKEIIELNDLVRDSNRQLRDLPLEELQSEEMHWNTRVAVAISALKAAEGRLEEFNSEIESNKKQLDGVEGRLIENSEAIKQSDEHKNDLHKHEHELNIVISDLRQQIEPTEKNLEALELEYSTHQVDQDAAQQAVAVADRNTTQSQLELLRYRDQLDSLRKKIEEDFGLVAFEYASDVAGPTPLPLEGMVEDLPFVEELPSEVEEAINRHRAQLRRLGAINPEAHNEYKEVNQRYEFLKDQVEDLTKADEDLRKVIAELDDLMRLEFHKTFDAVAAEFKQFFVRLFGGGAARLVLTNDENPTETGIDIEARLPGRREQGLSMLSGGERSLTAVALIFSLLKVSPTPFCVLDEVDAMLDESNVGRFCDLLKELCGKTQFIVVTHNRTTVQAADVIYGVTMGRDSASQVISLRLDEIDDEMMKES